MTRRPHAVVMRRRGAVGFLPGWLVLSDGGWAIIGSHAAALDFAARLTAQQLKEQAMTMPTITPTVQVLALERVLALAEHTLKTSPQLLTAVEDRQAINAVRDAANDAWLER